MSKDMLRDGLSEVCSGFYRAGLLTELISPSECYLEALHFVINTGNACFEVARNLFQYLLTAEGKARCRVTHPPDTWPKTTAGSWQTKEWRDNGYDWGALVQSKFGRRMARPHTKY
jgi:hypothetical protein